MNTPTRQPLLTALVGLVLAGSAGCNDKAPPRPAPDGARAEHPSPNIAPQSTAGPANTRTARAASPAAQLHEALAALPGAAVPPGKPTFDQLGCHAGDQLPAVPLRPLDDSDGEAHLQEIGQHGSVTLVVTSSLTCPKSRSMYPDVARLASDFKDIPVKLVYIVEAHPAGDPSPYGGVEDVTDENRREQVLCRQPTSMEERLKLARRFVDLLHIKVPVYVDAMDNAAWRALGGGPNMAFLVNSNGTVVYRQGWFDPKTMRKAIDLAANEAKARRENERTSQKVEHDDRPFGIDRWDLDRPFRDGDVAACRALLDAHPDLANYVAVEGRGNIFRTMLYHAAENKRREVVELLLGRGADPNLQVPGMSPALHAAARIGDVEIIRLLLRHGADVNRKLEPAGPTALQEALIHRHVEAAQLLRTNGAQPNFFTSVAGGELAAVRQRLREDPSLARRPDGAGRTPLCYAAGAGQQEMVRLLIEAGARDETRHNWDGESFALYWAIQAKDLAMAELLLSRNASRGNDGNFGEPFLHRALFDENIPLADLLLKYGADVNSESMRGYRPIHTAAERNKPAIIEWLYQAGADLNPRLGVDRSPCGSGHTDGALPLHLAARRGAMEAAKALLNHGVKNNAGKDDGSRPIHDAVEGNYERSIEKRLAMTRFLLDRGADINTWSDAGHSPLDRLRSSRREEADEKLDEPIERLLVERGAKAGSPETIETFQIVWSSIVDAFDSLGVSIRQERRNAGGLFGERFR